MKFAIQFLIDAVVGFIAASTFLYFVNDTPVGMNAVWIALFMTAVFRIFVWAIKLKTIYALSRSTTADGAEAVDIVALAPSKEATLFDQNQAVCQFAIEQTIVIDVFGFAFFKMGFIDTALKFKIKPDWDKYEEPKPENRAKTEKEIKAIHQKFLDKIAKLKKDKDDEGKQ